MARTLQLVTDATTQAAIGTSHLDLWEADRAAEGWTILTRIICTADANALQASIRAVRPQHTFLVGDDVPFLYSSQNPDGHGARPLAADYSFVTGNLETIPFGAVGRLWFSTQVSASPGGMNAYRNYFANRRLWPARWQNYGQTISFDDHLTIVGAPDSTWCTAVRAQIPASQFESVVLPQTDPDGEMVRLGTTPKMMEICFSGGQTTANPGGLFYFGGAARWRANNPQTPIFMGFGSFLCEIDWADSFLTSTLTTGHTLCALYNIDGVMPFGLMLTAGQTAGDVGLHGMTGGFNGPLTNVYGDPTFKTPTYVHAGANPQTPITNASLGDVLVYDGGVTFTGPLALPVKTGSVYLTIASSLLDNLPYGRQVAPADAANMPKFVTPGGNQSVFTAALGAHHYQFLGVEINPQDATVAPGDLVILGVGDFTQDTVAKIPYNFIFDRCYVHGFSTQNVKRGIRLNSATTDIANCYFSDFHLVGADSQAICGWTGPGPFRFINNYIEGACENIMFGGADPYITGLIPSDILIQGCTFFKPLSWKVGDPSYAGIHWSVKNLFEIKDAQRVTIDGNTFTNSWVDGQTGVCFSLKGVEQNGHASWSTCQNVTIQNNLIINVGQCLTIAGQTTQDKNLTIQNNRFQQVSGIFFQPSSVLNLTIDRNTSDSQGNIGQMAGGIGDCVNFILTNNIIPRSNASFGIKGAAAEGTASLNHHCTGYAMTGNIIVTTQAISARYPANNVFQAATPTGSFLGALTPLNIADTAVVLQMTVTAFGNGPTYTYQLQRADPLYGNPGAWSNIGVALAGQTGTATWTDSTVTAGTSYFYRVFVLDTYGATRNTNIVPLTTTGGGGTDVTRPLMGQALSVRQGSMVASGAGMNVTAALTGQALVARQGTLGFPNVSKPITGQSLVVGQGTLPGPSRTKALTGQSLAVGQGSLSPGNTEALSGQALTVTQGTVQASGANTTVTAMLTGQALAVNQGALAGSVTGGSVSAALTGQALSVARGSLVPGNTEALAGQSLVVAQGIMPPVVNGANVTVALVGQSLTVRIGTIVSLGDSADTTVTLVGQSLHVDQGDLEASGAEPIYITISGGGRRVLAGVGGGRN